MVDDILAAKGPRELWSGVTDQLTLADFITSGAYDRQLHRSRRPGRAPASVTR
jgi:GntR family transcriptional regulator / MocR family aminotransferase